MSNESDLEVCDTAIPPQKIGKRECEDEDEKEVITKKQKRDEVVEKQENKEEIISNHSEHDKKLEAKNETATGCGPSESLDVGSSDSDSHRSSDGDNPDDLESPEYNAGEIEEKVPKTPQEMHETPLALNEKYAASKTIYVRNLSYSVERADMENLFKDCGELVAVRFNTDREGRFRGFGHIEFGTEEAAQKALELDNTELLRRRIKVGIALEKNEYAPYGSSFPKGGNLQSHTVKGFDTSLVENKPKSPATPNESLAASKTIYVRNLSYIVERTDMENLFKGCGEIVDIRLHSDREGRFKGFGHVQFATAEAAQKALALDNVEFFKRNIIVGIASERGKYSPNRSVSSWAWSSSFQKDERLQSQTAPVKCIDTTLADDKDIEMFDAVYSENKPETPTTRKEKKAVSKTVCVRNLSFGVERADIENIFKDCGEIVDVRLHVDVEFATEEATEKALELDHRELMNRPIKVGTASKEGECFHNRSSLSISFQKGENLHPLTVFVIGFDTSIAEEKIKASLKRHFSPCGEITRISLPRFPDSGTVKGFAHLDFKDVDGYKKALQLDQTAIGDYWLSVEKAKPRYRRDYQAIGGGRGGGGYHYGGRDGGDHGGRVGWGRSHGVGRHWTANTEHW
ncbi:uncharacterized protein [Cicer arietinum]|uniref:Nucleolin 1 isoform X3 n=1 Tax=Cicer arietinum TaxID=3827 RepID=A0A1S3EJ45_CICAR|nr:nucleolin 1 isoform X3 [Cicer arietinum]